MQAMHFIPIPGAQSRQDDCYSMLGHEEELLLADALQPCSPALHHQEQLLRGWTQRGAHHQQHQLAGAAVVGSLPRTGHKRACEASSCAGDGSDEEEDVSMATSIGTSMRRSGSTRSLSIKRVCSVASADALSPYSTPCSLPQPHALARAASGRSLQFGSSHAAAAHAAAAKRSGSHGHSSLSSQDGLPSSTSPSQLGGGGGGSTGSGGHARAPHARGPRVRLGGRLLTPEEAQRHLAAVAAASASKAHSRAPSPSVAMDAASPAARGGLAAVAQQDCSTTSLSAGGAPCFSMGRAASISSAMPCQRQLHSGSCFTPATGAAAAAAVAAMAGAACGPAALTLGGAAAADECLPEDFIPTPEQAGAWQTLASTLDDTSAATAAGVGMFAAAFAAPASQHGAAWQQAPAPAAAAHAPHAAAWAVPLPLPQQLLPAFTTGASAPVCIGSAPARADWTAAGGDMRHSTGSLTSSSSLVGTPTLASSFAVPQPLHAAVCFAAGNGSGSGMPTPAPAPPSAVDEELSRLLGTWAPEQQQQPALLAPVAVHGSSGNVAALQQGLTTASAATAAGAPAAGAPGAASAAGWKPAFGSAFSPAGPSVPARPPPAASVGGSAANDDSAAAAAAPLLGSTGMMPTPGLAAPLPPHQESLPAAAPAGLKLRIKVPSSRARRQQQQQHQHSSMLPLAAAAPSSSGPAAAAAAASDARLVLSQQQLLAVMQESMAASYASGYMAAQRQQPGDSHAPATAPAAAPLTTAGAAAAPAAPGCQGGQMVDDILPSLQELLTECFC